MTFYMVSGDFGADPGLKVPISLKLTAEQAKRLPRKRISPSPQSPSGFRQQCPHGEARDFQYQKVLNAEYVSLTGTDAESDITAVDGADGAADVLLTAGVVIVVTGMADRKKPPDSIRQRFP